MLFTFFISIYCIFFDNSIFGLVATSNLKSHQPVVGQIDEFKRDIRRKDSNSILWQEAKRGDKIRVGDRIFSGKQSSLHIDLEGGVSFDLGENSMVIFSTAEGKSIANLNFGKMKVEVDGSVKIAVNGKVQTIKGKKSQVEVSVDSKQKTKFRVLRGAAEVVSESPQKANVKLVKNKVPVIQIKPDAIVVTPQLVPRSAQTSFNYTDRLYDFYEASSQKLSLRDQRRSQIQRAVKLEWDTKGIVRQIEGQLSANASFEAPMQSFESEADSYQLKTVCLGKNFWRVKASNTDWSQPVQFWVTPQPLGVLPPRLHLAASTYYLVSDRVQVKIAIEASAQLSNFVVEYSNSPNFSSAETQVRFRKTKNIEFGVTGPQDVYVRAKGVNTSTELTSYSQAVKIRVREAPMPIVPSLAEKVYRIFPDQNLDVEWAPVEHAQGYEIQLRDHTHQIIENQKLRQNLRQFKISKVGKYEIQLSSIDRFGRKSTGAFAKVIVEPRLINPILSRRIAQPQVRKVSSVSEMSTTQKMDSLLNINQKYSSSTIEINGGGETAISSQDLSTGVTAYHESSSIGLKVTHWLVHSGFEGFFGTKIADLNSASSEVSSVQVEARYHYRWSIPWNLFSNINATQFSLVGGYEYYRNGKTDTFSPGYDILKAGFALTFPVLKRWDAGGEVLYGKAFDSSTQYEISGKANYYIRSDWTIGVGYRIHLFDAGSAASAPSSGIPYREGSGEAFSAISKHF